MELASTHHRSALGEWRMSMAPAPTRLAGSAALLWDVQGLTHAAVETILPSAHVEILFNLADDQYLLDLSAPAGRIRYRSVWISGLQDRPLRVESGSFAHVVGVRLTPLGAWRLLGLPVGEISGKVVDLDLILGPSLEHLRDQLASFPNPAQRLRRLADFVHRRVVRGPAVHPAVSLALDHLGASTGHPSVRDLLAVTGVSNKHLVRKFNQQIGAPPKRFAGMVRFNRAVEAIKAQPGRHLATLAADLGYFDQAHLNREFRRFAQTTPTDFARRMLPDDVTATLV